jgi:hypothetical protein
MTSERVAKTRKFSHSDRRSGRELQKRNTASHLRPGIGRRGHCLSNIGRPIVARTWSRAPTLGLVARSVGVGFLSPNKEPLKPRTASEGDYNKSGSNPHAYQSGVLG